MVTNGNGDVLRDLFLRVVGMQSDCTRLLEIFKDLHELRSHYTKIQSIKNKLRDMLDEKDLEEIRNLTDVDFEAKLAGNIHPGMRSFPEPLGRRYTDVQGYVEKVKRKQNTGVEDLPSYENYLQRAGLDETCYCFGTDYAPSSINRSYSPTHSGLNVDPTTFCFATTATDKLIYFDSTKLDERQTMGGSDHSGSSSTGYNESSLPVIKHTRTNEMAPTRAISRERMDDIKGNVKFDVGDGKYWTKSDEDSLDQFLYYRDFLKIRSKKQISEEAKANVESKYPNQMKHILISQTWLTSWIKDLYEIEENINDIVGKNSCH